MALNRNNNSSRRTGNLSQASRGRSGASQPRSYGVPSQRGRGSSYGASGSRGASRRQATTRGQVSSVRIGDIDRTHFERNRQMRADNRYRNYMVRLGLLTSVVLVLVVAGAALYFSDLFPVEEIKVEGAEHLTTREMQALAQVPSDTTLLRVDTGAIEKNLLRDAWIQDVAIHRDFPNTLRIVVTEREISAVVEVPTENAKSTQPWAISSDGIWLMAIPNQDTDIGQTISQQIYTDVENVLHITDVPYGIEPEIGSHCSDENVNNALAIVAGMTTELADQVKTVSATDAESTKLTLDNGVEIAFGKAEDIREKERVCLELMKQNPDKIAYINVRSVDRVTYRSL